MLASSISSSCSSSDSTSYLNEFVRQMIASYPTEEQLAYMIAGNYTNYIAELSRESSAMALSHKQVRWSCASHNWFLHEHYMVVVVVNRLLIQMKMKAVALSRNQQAFKRRFSYLNNEHKKKMMKEVVMSKCPKRYSPTNNFMHCYFSPFCA